MTTSNDRKDAQRLRSERMAWRTDDIIVYGEDDDPNKKLPHAERRRRINESLRRLRS